MITEFVSLFAELNAKQLEELTKEVKETVAHEVVIKNNKSVFTAANLWNIHNQKRSTTIKKHYML